jgi:8-oxo-dGTP pyrophosphatase MutT (NUDIX family)
MIPSVTGLVRDDDGRLLMMQRSDTRRWELPSGQIEPGEAPAQALVREVWEETGLVVRPERLVGVFGGREGFRFVYPHGDEIEVFVSVFECRVVGGALGNRDGEALDLRFFAWDEMPELIAGYPRELFAPGARPPAFQWKEEWLAPGSG